MGRTVHNRSRSAILCVLPILAVGTLPAQEREDRTLLPWEQMRTIINEASGDRAMHHLLRPQGSLSSGFPHSRGSAVDEVDEAVGEAGAAREAAAVPPCRTT